LRGARAYAFIEGRRKLASFGGGPVLRWFTPTRLRDVDRRRVRIIPEWTELASLGRRKLRTRLEIFDLTVDDWVRIERPEWFVRHVYNEEEARLGYGRGLLEAIYFYHYAKQVALREGLQGLERWAQGLAVAKIDGVRVASTGKPNTAIATAWLDAIKKTKARHGLVIDKQDELEVYYPKGEGHGLVRDFLTYLDEGIVKLITGALRPTGGGEGGAYNRAETEQDEQEALVRYDRALMDEVITRDLVGLVWRANWSNLVKCGLAGAKMPRFRSEHQRKEDPQIAADVFTKLMSVEGFKVRKDEVYKKTGYSMPRPEDEVFEGSGAPEPGGGPPGVPGFPSFDALTPTKPRDPAALPMPSPREGEVGPPPKGGGAPPKEPITLEDLERYGSRFRDAGGGTPAPFALTTVDRLAEWREEDHPRADDGRFGPGSGEASTEKETKVVPSGGSLGIRWEADVSGATKDSVVFAIYSVRKRWPWAASELEAVKGAIVEDALAHKSRKNLYLSEGFDEKIEGFIEEWGVEPGSWPLFVGVENGVETPEVVESVIRHELGHMIEGQILNSDESFYRKELEPILLEFKESESNIFPSSYAMEDPSELFAEAVSEAFCDRKQSELGRRITEALDRWVPPGDQQRARFADWNEEDHPRDEDGQFAPTEGGGRPEKPKRSSDLRRDLGDLVDIGSWGRGENQFDLWLEGYYEDPKEGGGQDWLEEVDGVPIPPLVKEHLEERGKLEEAIERKKEITDRFQREQTPAGRKEFHLASVGYYDEMPDEIRGLADKVLSGEISYQGDAARDLRNWLDDENNPTNPIKGEWHLAMDEAKEERREARKARRGFLKFRPESYVGKSERPIYDLAVERVPGGIESPNVKAETLPSPEAYSEMRSAWKKLPSHVRTRLHAMGVDIRHDPEESKGKVGTSFKKSHYAYFSGGRVVLTDGEGRYTGPNPDDDWSYQAFAHELGHAFHLTNRYEDPDNRLGITEDAYEAFDDLYKNRIIRYEDALIRYGKKAKKELERSAERMREKLLDLIDRQREHEPGSAEYEGLEARIQGEHAWFQDHVKNASKLDKALSAIKAERSKFGEKGVVGRHFGLNGDADVKDLVTFLEGYASNAAFSDSFKKTKDMEKAKRAQRKVFGKVSLYSLTNSHEYFAEGFKEHILYPDRLEESDPYLSRWMKEAFNASSDL